MRGGVHQGDGVWLVFEAVFHAVAVAFEDDGIIATTNVGHLSRFTAADIWPNIVPSEPAPTRES